MRFSVSSPKQRALLVIVLVIISLAPISYFLARDQARNEITDFLSSATLEISSLNITEEIIEGVYVSGILLVNSAQASPSSSFFKIHPVSLEANLKEKGESLGSINLSLGDNPKIQKNKNITSFPFSTFLSLGKADNNQFSSNKFLEKLFTKSPLVLEVSGILKYEFLGAKDSASFVNTLIVTALASYNLLTISSIDTETARDNEIDIVVQLHNPFQISFSIDGSFHVFVNQTRIGTLDLNSSIFLPPGTTTSVIPLKLALPINDLIQLITLLSNFTIALEGSLSIELKHHRFLLDYSLDLPLSNGSILGARIIDISNVSISLETLTIGLLLSTNITNSSPLILTIAQANVSIFTTDWEFLANGTWEPATLSIIDAYGFLLIYDLPILATNVSLGNLLQVGIEQTINLEICLKLKIASSFVDVCLLVPNVEF